MSLYTRFPPDPYANSAALDHTANADTSLARYQLLSQRSRDIFLFVRRGDLRILEVNDAALAHYGYSREAFLRMTMNDIRPSEDVPAMLAAIANQQETPSVDGPWRPST